MLHHDNVHVHTLLLVRDFCSKNAMTVVAQLPYSPDLTTAEFFFSSKMEKPMKGKWFDDVEAVKNKNEIARGAEEYSDGAGAGKSVLPPEESTVKGIQFCNTKCMLLF